ncbi:MAG: amino acid ABC transporter substrate-binding protein [candidate division NC10 bacterium]|nr:amino acid ABC transporter substrate-binding protein [candidate division NC10 bacterium]MBI4841382.1 amino acid ABC transporter substrate-binding protein [candidate division NC10 bacterium]
MRRQRILLVLAVALVAVAGMVLPASAQNVKLAIVAEITGGGAPVGAMWRDGVSLAVEDINKKGGILGRRLETFLMDTQSDPPTSVAVMRRAINEHPFAILGTVYSSSTVANMDIARQAGVPQITGSESVLITQKGNPNIFLTSFTQQIGFAKLVRWVAEDLKAEKIALIYVNNAFGRGGREMFLKFLKDRGKSVVADLSTEPQQADFTAELTRVRASGATHLMIYSHEEENARLMIQLRKLGLAVEPVGDNLCAQTTIDPGGEAMNGAKCHVPMTAASPVPSMLDVGRRFQEKYGRVPDHNGFKAYIGTHMVKAAVERVGAFDQAKVRDCLHNNLFTAAEEPGLLMDVYVDDKGDTDRGSFIVQVKNRKSEVIKVVGMLGGPYTKRACR